MANRLSALRVPRVSFVARAAVRDPANPTEPRRFLFTKSEGTPPAPEKGDPVGLTDAQKAELDPAVLEIVEKAEKDAADAREAQTKAEGERDEALEKAASAGGGEGGGKGDGRESDDDKKPVSKEELEKLSPEVRAIVEKSEADRAADRTRLEKAEERAENAEKLAKEERETREVAVFVTKAETGDFRGLPGKPQEIGKAMYDLSKAAPEAWATLESEVLAPSVALIRQSEVMKQQGVGGEGPPPESALRKFQDKVTDLMKSDSSLTKSEAQERVRKSDPDLQQAIAEEVGSAGASA